MGGQLEKISLQLLHGICERVELVSAWGSSVAVTAHQHVREQQADVQKSCLGGKPGVRSHALSIAFSVQYTEGFWESVSGGRDPHLAGVPRL